MLPYTEVYSTSYKALLSHVKFPFQHVRLCIQSSALSKRYHLMRWKEPGMYLQGQKINKTPRRYMFGHKKKPISPKYFEQNTLNQHLPPSPDPSHATTGLQLLYSNRLKAGENKIKKNTTGLCYRRKRHRFRSDVFRVKISVSILAAENLVSASLSLSSSVSLAPPSEVSNGDKYRHEKWVFAAMLNLRLLKGVRKHTL